MPRKSPITAAQELELLRLYQEDISRNELARRFGASRHFVTDFLQRNGLRIRGIKEASCLHNALPVNHAAFDDAANHEEAAYWVGFLMADGCIGRTGSTRYVILQIGEVDSDHLKAFRSFLQSEHKIGFIPCQPRFPGSSPMVRLAVGSDRLVDALGRHGVTPHKSATASVNGLENNRHFWRGVVDGDGNLRFRRRTANCETANLQMVGSRPLLEQFAAFVRLHCSAKANIYREKRSADAWCMQLHSTHAVTMARILYDNCKVALPRKLAVAEKFMTRVWSAGGNFSASGKVARADRVNGCKSKPR